MNIKEQKIADIRKQMNGIISLVEKESKEKIAIHKVELKVLSELLKIGLSLIKYYIMLIGFSLKNKTKLDMSSAFPIRFSGVFFIRFLILEGLFL